MSNNSEGERTLQNILQGLQPSKTQRTEIERALNVGMQNVMNAALNNPVRTPAAPEVVQVMNTVIERANQAALQAAHEHNVALGSPLPPSQVKQVAAQATASLQNTLKDLASKWKK